jgi:CDP-paratose 2-epimerase
MKKVFITGGAGFIGFNCAKFFNEKKFQVKIYDNLSRKSSKINLIQLKKKSKFINIEIGSTSNFSKFKKSILDFKPDLIINCAGQVAVTQSIINPREDLESNILGTFNLLEILRINSLDCKLIHLSTNKVYGDLKNTHIGENHKRYFFLNKKFNQGLSESSQLDFISPYGCSKGSADQYVLDYSRIYKLQNIILRQSCIYGPNQFGLEGQGWVAWMILCSLLNKKIKIFGSGKQVRDILHVSDLCELFYKIYKSKYSYQKNFFNIGGGHKNSLSLLELLDLLEAINIKKIKKKFFYTRQGDQKIFISNNSKASSYYNWSPKVSSYNGVYLVNLWIKENLKIFKNIYGN